MATADIELHLSFNDIWEIIATLWPNVHLLCRKLCKQIDRWIWTEVLPVQQTAYWTLNSRQARKSEGMNMINHHDWVVNSEQNPNGSSRNRTLTRLTHFLGLTSQRCFKKLNPNLGELIQNTERGVKRFWGQGVGNKGTKASVGCRDLGSLQYLI